MEATSKRCTLRGQEEMKHALVTSKVHPHDPHAFYRHRAALVIDHQPSFASAPLSVQQALQQAVQKVPVVNMTDSGLYFFSQLWLHSIALAFGVALDPGLSRYNYH